jgi:hypothetical protein
MLIEVERMQCDRCQERVLELYSSEDLSSKRCEIVGTPWYCYSCMKETGQTPLDNRTFRVRYVNQRQRWVDRLV